MNADKFPFHFKNMDFHDIEQVMWVIETMLVNVLSPFHANVISNPILKFPTSENCLQFAAEK